MKPIVCTVATRSVSTEMDHVGTARNAPLPTYAVTSIRKFESYHLASPEVGQLVAVLARQYRTIMI
jgi:hypothetical protein